MYNKAFDNIFYINWSHFKIAKIETVQYYWNACCFSLHTAEPIVQVDGKPSCCFFKFSPKLMFTKVLKAQLWVYLRPLQQTSTVYLQILRLKPVTDQGSRHIRIRSLKIELNSQSGYWQSIDFKHVLQNWFKQPQTNWGIDINAFDESGNDLAVTSLRPGEEGLVRTLRPADDGGIIDNVFILCCSRFFSYLIHEIAQI